MVAMNLRSPVERGEFTLMSHVLCVTNNVCLSGWELESNLGYLCIKIHSGWSITWNVADSWNHRTGGNDCLLQCLLPVSWPLSVSHIQYGPCSTKGNGELRIVTTASTAKLHSTLLNPLVTLPHQAQRDLLSAPDRESNTQEQQCLHKCSVMLAIWLRCMLTEELDNSYCKSCLSREQMITNQKVTCLHWKGLMLSLQITNTICNQIQTSKILDSIWTHTAHLYIN